MERGGGRESVAVDAVSATDTVSQRRVAMEVAGLAVWGGAQRRTKLTDEQVPLSLSALASAQSIHPVLIAPPYIGLSQLVTGDCCRFFSRFLQGVHSVDGWTEWTQWTVCGQRWTLVDIPRFAAFWQRRFCRLRISSYHCSRK